MWCLLGIQPATWQAVWRVGHWVLRSQCRSAWLRRRRHPHYGVGKKENRGEQLRGRCISVDSHQHLCLCVLSLEQFKDKPPSACLPVLSRALTLSFKGILLLLSYLASPGWWLHSLNTLWPISHQEWLFPWLLETSTLFILVLSQSHSPFCQMHRILRVHGLVFYWW